MNNACKIKYSLILLLTLLTIITSLFFIGCINSEPEPETITVTYSATEGGSITGKSNQKLVYGTDGESVTAIPNTGYKFVKWSDGSTLQTRTETNVTENITVTAIFAKLTYTVTYKADYNGTVSGTASQTVEYGGSSSSVTAVPNEGYKFVKWSDGSTLQTRTETNVTENTTLTAIFEKLIFTVTYKTDGSGTISGSASQTVEYGDSSSSVTAVPYEGYKFVKWSDGDTKVTRTETNVTENITLTAIFEKFTVSENLTYSVSYQTDGNGKIEGEANQTVQHGGSSSSVTAVPNEGYKFVKWSDGETKATRTDTNITADITVTATFEKITFKVTYKTDGNGYISGSATQTVMYGANSSYVTAIPNDTYIFVEWSDGVKTASRMDSKVKEDITVTAKFERQNVIVYYFADAFGTIEGEARQTIAYGGSTTAVTVIPKEGYRFVMWSDGVTEPTRQDNNVVTSITLSAKYEKIAVTVTYTTQGNGTIKGEAVQTIGYGEWTSTVTAVPDEGYRFVEWSDGNTSLSRVDRNIKEDTTITAIFEELILKVSYRIEAGYILVDGEEFHASYTQNVKYGRDTTKKVKPVLYNSGINSGFTYKYVFLKWSDGVETEERYDYNVTEDISVTAIFGIRLTYSVDGNKGGKLLGNCTQIIEEGSDAEKVTAVPDDGYVFDGWSDWSNQMMNPERQEINVVKSTNYVAYFAPIEKTFKYDYGEEFTAPMTNEITINRYKLKEVKFVLPVMRGYTFCGWYVDKEFTVKLANENGKLMLGYYTFNLDTDTIYAKWKKNADEEVLTYKILTVCVEGIRIPNLKLYSDSDLTEDVHFTMSAVFRQIYSMYSPKVARYLNTWFEGRINFEVDTYFTTEILGNDSFYYFDGGPAYDNRYCYKLTNTDISDKNLDEISDVVDDYRNVLSIYDFGPEYSVQLRMGAGGYGDTKFGTIYIDPWYTHKDEIDSYEQQLRSKFNDEESTLWIECAASYLHEFCHTIEFKFNEYITPSIGTFHRVSYGHELLNSKYYLLGIAVVDGQTVGVPFTYWEEGGDYMF